MNIIFTLKDFVFDIEENSFFDGANISDGNYDDDIDQRIDTFLSTYRNKNIETFTIPISISNNFMEFSGLIFAHHLRLTRELEFCDALIVFYGTLELEELLRLTPLARILITRNILYVNIIKYSFHDIKTIIQSYKPKSFQLTQFLDQIQINPPSNYDTHHSIDNEFALMQWSRYIKCFNSLPQHFKKEFDSKLYFKFLKAKYYLSEINDYTEFAISTIKNTRILLIDDESQKGWETFYKSLFKNSEIVFEDSGIEFKNVAKSELIVKIESRVKNFDPHIVLLDLRLHDSDFGEDIEPEDLTGLQVLKKIKELNRGIQVIITTASNKAWNFNIATQNGAYDFIIKDGFEKPEIAIYKFNSVIEISSKRAGFLKLIDQKMSEIRALISSNNHFNFKDDKENELYEIKEEKIRKKMFSNLEIAFELLDLSYKIPGKQKYLSYSFLQLFLLIEDFANPDSSEKQVPILFKESDQVFISHSQKKICIIQNKESKRLTRLVFDSKYKIVENIAEFKWKMDTNFYVSSILIYKYGNPNSSVKEWTSIYKVRNNVAHEGYMPNVSEIKKLLDFMLYFFNNSNESEMNIDKGIVPITYEESLQVLKEKFNNR